VTDNGIKVFATLDFTNPAAVDFYKNIIKQNVLEGAASSGYMCDFGEYIPFDALMFDGQSGA
jgi:alpha-glucosidase